MTKIIGHRGAAGLALENTLESIQTALNYPLYAVEMDVRRTKDGALVLLHDNHTRRVADRTIYTGETTLKELRRLKLKNGERIPTLEEALQLVGGKIPIMLDIKDDGTHEAIVRLLKSHSEAKIIISGRKYTNSQKIHGDLPKTIFLMQHHFDPMEIIHRAVMMGAQGISLNMWLVNPLNYRLARRRGLKIFVYTVNYRWIRWLFQKLYPEAVLITNHPEKML